MARSTAAAALAQIGTPAAAKALVANLADERADGPRQAAVAGLEKMEAAALPALEQMAEDHPSAVQRRNAAEVLGWIADPQSVATLAQVVRRDSAVAVRSEAAWALGEIGGSQARQALQSTLQSDSDATVRSASAQALARGEAIQASAAPSKPATQPELLAHLADLLAPPELDLARQYAAGAGGARHTAPGAAAVEGWTLNHGAGNQCKGQGLWCKVSWAS